jgi:hypothetical protein
VRYWKHDNHWWSTEWIPVANMAVIDIERYLRWVEGTQVWDRPIEVGR